MDALAKLKARFDNQLSQPVDVQTYEGGEWWQLHPAEAFVFGLALEDVPALVVAWEFYEAIADITLNDFHDTPLCIEARAALPYIEQDHTENPQAWQRFAASLGIRGRTAHAWYQKIMFGLDRAGTAIWSDDSLPMPRAPELPAATHAPVYDLASDSDELDRPIPF